MNVPADYTWYEDDSIRLPATSTVNLMETTRISKMTDFKIDLDFPASEFLPPVPFTHQDSAGKKAPKTEVKKAPEAEAKK